MSSGHQPASLAEPAAQEGASEPQRAPDRRRQRPRRASLVAGALLTAGALWWVGWASPVTLVQHVVVTAPRGISDAEVRRASGISAQDHVPAVDAAKVRANVLAALPAVAAVEVSRALPDTVKVTVTAREPLAVLPRGSTFVVIDAAGVPFGEMSSPKKLPVVEATSAAASEAVLTVLRSLPGELRSDVRRAVATTQQDVDLVLAGGAIVRWGNGDQAQLKARVLDGLRVVEATHYDVSAPLMPTTRGGQVPAPE